MEIILVIAVAIIFYMVLTIRNNQAASQQFIAKEITAFKKLLSDLQEQIEINGVHGDEIAKTRMQQQEAEALKEHLERIAAIEARKQFLAQPKASAVPQTMMSESKSAPQMVAPGKHAGTPPIPKENWVQRWIQNNPDLEKFIGENLFNKIGIAVLVLGIGFFVKYAIDQDWINEYGRVAIGICCGAALVGIAHYLRKTYQSFSSVLAGGGLAVFYFTIAFAFHQYHIITQAEAFIIMVIITIFAVLLAILYDKIELAIIATVGGFITPFILSTGEGNYVVLFSYLALLNIGLLALSYFKKWRILNTLALFFTVVIYASWLVKTFLISPVSPPYIGALIFASLFYLLFVGMNMIYNITKREKFTGFDFAILLIINCLYFAAGMVTLQNYDEGNFSGLFTILLGALNFALAWYFFKVDKGDKNLVYLLIGLTLTFLSLAAPIQLQGKSITLFWCAEIVLLIWLFGRSKIVLFNTASIIITVITLVSLVMDWQQAGSRSSSALPLIYTGLKGLITNVVAIISFGLAGRMLSAEPTINPWLAGISTKNSMMFYFVFAGLILYLTLVYGVNLFFADGSDLVIPNIYHRTITYFTGIVLLYLLGRTAANRNIILIQFGILSCCFLFYASSLDYNSLFVHRYVEGRAINVHFLMKWFSDVTLLLVFYYAIAMLRKNALYITDLLRMLSWLICGMLVIIFSVEFNHLYLVMFAHPQSILAYQLQFNKAGVTIIWGSCSFAMMWLGMKYHYKTLRIISITLFALSLVKLFSYDISTVGAGGKIGAFISLGVLLLIMSFMYQRLKKILIDDGVK